jgi:cell division protein FtsL
MTRRGGVLVVFVVFLALVGAALAHVSLRLGVIRLGYEISERTQTRRELEEEHRRLSVELSMLRSPERIERLAGAKLGMRRPDAGEIRVAEPQSELAQAAVCEAAWNIPKTQTGASPLFLAECSEATWRRSRRSEGAEQGRQLAAAGAGPTAAGEQ